MPLIIKLGYTQYAFPEGALDALKGGIFEVEEKSVKGKRKYVVNGETDVEIKIISSNMIVLPDTEEEQLLYKELYKEKDKDASTYMSKLWNAETEIKTLKTQIEALKSVCPESHAAKED